MAKMKTEDVKLSSVTLDPANARRHSERQIEVLKKLLARFGQQTPIVIDSAGVIRKGNGTWLAAQALGWSKIAIVRSDLPLEEVKAYALGDNKSALLGEWDDDILAQLLADEKIGDVGFDESEIDALLSPVTDLDESISSRNLGTNTKSATVKALFSVPDVAIVERAIAACGTQNRGEALTMICRSYLDAKGQFDIPA